MSELEAKLEEIRQKHLAKLTAKELAEHAKTVHLGEKQRTGRNRDNKMHYISKCFNLNITTLRGWRRGIGKDGKTHLPGRQRLYQFLYSLDEEIYKELLK